MFEQRNRGTVLVASLIILALLSLMGASSLLNSTLDTQLAANRSQSSEAFYAAEAGLDAGVGLIYEFVTANLRPYDPTSAGTTNWTTPTDPAAVNFTDINGYNVEYRITYAGTLWPSGEPRAYQFSNIQSGASLDSDAYTYRIDARAVSNTGDGTMQQMSETLQVLETPLIQYFVFFEDDLGWHHGPAMTSWGRIHTNGDLGMANQDVFTLRNYDNAGNQTPCVITVSGDLLYEGHLQQDGTWSSRTTDPIYVRVDNSSTIPASGPPGGDFEEINTTIDGTTKAVQEERFKETTAGGDTIYHVRVGVDPMPSASIQDIERGQFYETEAAAPWKPQVDGLVINADTGLEIIFNPHDGASQDVTTLVRNFEVASGVSADIAGWFQGARTNADNTTAPATAPARGSIVYCPSDFVAENDGWGTAYTDYQGAGANPWFPAMLEYEDERDTSEVSLLVIDVQRLQEWYRDYLDYRDGGGLDNSIDSALTNRSLLIYASLTNAGTVTGMPAVKLIGSRAGRTRDVIDNQISPSLRVRTTLVTDNPIYLEGDFNAPGADGGDYSPGGMGCAILSDALTLLSNEWGRDKFVLAAPNTGASFSEDPADTESAFNAAFFTGRYNFRDFPTTGEEAGIHNFPHFLENWNVDCHITGCMINLWFSSQSDGRHHGGYYGPPGREFGWDAGFANRGYWPPYVPSIYSVERTAWRED